MSTEYQPRYIAYAKANGRTPDEMLLVDEKLWPGGKMTGFMLWISQQWRKFSKATGHRPPYGLVEHAQFDIWLNATKTDAEALTNSTKNITNTETAANLENTKSVLR